ncbi:response regulator transcription factor [Streptomyces mirabilis]|jgi:DNA-binding NarL/FixJ family response regulator|uniref:response regulator transcription factor n=1 Tax=Streptomyces mirabilis TaxID=68239 RepID=UPI0022C947EE|nr:response regulator transcription factor [Streptomyces mirabilis]
MTVRVVVVDDETLVRAGFRVLLESENDLQVVGEAADGTEAVRVIRELRPDVALMDIRMPGINGIEAIRTLLGGPSPVPVHVLVLTTFDLDEYVFEALRAGAAGFLLKDTPPARLIDAVRVIATGESLLSPGVTRRLIETYVRRPGYTGPVTHALDGVTGRERDVLGLIARGLSNNEIAAELYLTVGTVKTHVSRLLTKLGARDRAQLVIAAYESGLSSTWGARGT